MLWAQIEEPERTEDMYIHEAPSASELDSENEISALFSSNSSSDLTSFCRHYKPCRPTDFYLSKWFKINFRSNVDMYCI